MPHQNFISFYTCLIVQNMFLWVEKSLNPSALFTTLLRVLIWNITSCLFILFDLLKYHEYMFCIGWETLWSLSKSLHTCITHELKYGTCVICWHKAHKLFRMDYMWCRLNLGACCLSVMWFVAFYFYWYFEVCLTNHLSRWIMIWNWATCHVVLREE